MKNIIALSFILLMFSACDQFSRAFLINATSQTITLVANAEINNGNPSLINLVDETNGRFTYEFDANASYVLAGALNSSITENSFPYDTLIVIYNADTLQMNSRTEILQAMVIVDDGRMELRIED